MSYPLWCAPRTHVRLRKTKGLVYAEQLFRNFPLEGIEFAAMWTLHVVTFPDNFKNRIHCRSIFGCNVTKQRLIIYRRRDAEHFCTMIVASKSDYKETVYHSIISDRISNVCVCAMWYCVGNKTPHSTHSSQCSQECKYLVLSLMHTHSLWRNIVTLHFCCIASSLCSLTINSIFSHHVASTMWLHTLL